MTLFTEEAGAENTNIYRVLQFVMQAGSMREESLFILLVAVLSAFYTGRSSFLLSVCTDDISAHRGSMEIDGQQVEESPAMATWGRRAEDQN